MVKTGLAIQAFLKNRLSKGLTPRSIQWYDELLNRFAEQNPELPTEPEPIEGFLISHNISTETKRSYFGALKVFYHFVNLRYSMPDPTRKIATPQRSRKLMPSLEPRETLQLINLAGNLRDRTLITLLADTGARVGEVAGLRRQDIGEETITVSGKTGERQIPISDETRRLLLALAADSKVDRIFLNSRGQPISTNGIYKIVHELMQKAGIKAPKLGPHRLRHAFGKNYLVSGGDIRSLQQIMGHSSIITTQKYASLSLSDTIAKHHKFTPLRAAHAAAQESFFDTSQAVKEAEAIIAGEEN